MNDFTNATEVERLEALRTLGLSISSEFVPFSRSRNAGEKHPSLNWKVTLLHRGKAFRTVDYGAGSAHCPSYRQRATVDSDACVRAECERGVRCVMARGVPDVRGVPAHPHAPILPGEVNVWHSLALDASVLDAGSFESWASEYGYDTDSRKAEATYRACLEIALSLRAVLGEAGLAELQRIVEGY